MKPVLFLAAVMLSMTAAGCGGPSPAPLVGETGGAAAETVTDEATVDGTALQLVRRGDGCVVKTSGSEIPLQPKAPCFFLRRGGAVQQYSYRDTGTEWVVLAGGTEASAGTRESWRLPAGEVCGEQAQGILSRSGAVRASKTVHTGGVYCKEKGVDEKDFWTVGHEKE